MKFENGTAVSVLWSQSTVLRELDLSDMAKATIAGDGHHVVIAARSFSARDIIADLLKIETLASSGRQGGKSRSAEKIAASRANGQRGGRPRLPPPPID